LLIFFFREQKKTEHDTMFEYSKSQRNPKTKLYNSFLHKLLENRT
ncbi:unnamed protein product, partial [Brassica rapa subsp. trilocularis]